MALSYVYVVKREDAEGDVSILSAHATKKSAEVAAGEENGTAEVEKIELIGGTVTASKSKSPAPSANTKAKKGTGPSKKKESSSDIPDADPTALSGEAILFTGELARMTRPEAQHMAQSAGARTVTSVSKNVTLVVLGQRAGPDKMKKIEQFGIKTVGEDEFLELIKSDGATAGSKRAVDDDDEDIDDNGEEEVKEPAPKKRSKKAKV